MPRGKPPGTHSRSTDQCGIERRTASWATTPRPAPRPFSSHSMKLSPKVVECRLSGFQDCPCGVHRCMTAPVGRHKVFSHVVRSTVRGARGKQMQPRPVSGTDGRRWVRVFHENCFPPLDEASSGERRARITSEAKLVDIQQARKRKAPIPGCT